MDGKPNLIDEPYQKRWRRWAANDPHYQKLLADKVQAAGRLKAYERMLRRKCLFFDRRVKKTQEVRNLESERVWRQIALREMLHYASRKTRSNPKVRAAFERAPKEIYRAEQPNGSGSVGSMGTLDNQVGEESDNDRAIPPDPEPMGGGHWDTPGSGS